MLICAVLLDRLGQIDRRPGDVGQLASVDRRTDGAGEGDEHDQGIRWVLGSGRYSQSTESVGLAIWRHCPSKGLDRVLTTVAVSAIYRLPLRRSSSTQSVRHVLP